MQTVSRGVVVLLLPWILASGVAAQLDPEILVDRYLVRVERLIAEEDYGAALQVLGDVVSVQREHDLALPDEFHFVHAQVALSAGSIYVAIESVTRYLTVAGRSGEFYREALRLSDEAEAEAEGRRPGAVSRDCAVCPEMVVMPGGRVALGRYEVTVGQYRAFASATGGGAGGCIGSGSSWRDPQRSPHFIT